MIEHVKELLATERRSRAGWALTRCGTVRSALMTGGIAYTGMLSVPVALVIGVSMLMVMLSQHPTIRTVAVDSISSLLPEVVDTGDGRGFVSVEQLTLPPTLNLGLVLVVGASIYSVISPMGTLEITLWVVSGLVSPVMRSVIRQLTNIAGFPVITAGVLVTAMASVVTTTLSGSAGRSLGLPQSLTGTGAWVTMLLLSFFIGTGVLVLLITACDIRPPRRGLLQGRVLGALVLDALCRVGIGAIGSVTCNPLSASFAAIAVLTLWLHLTSRVVLLVAAWMINPSLSRDVDHPGEVHVHERPNYVTPSVFAILAWLCQPIIDNLEADSMVYPDYVPPVPIP